jgi:tripartite-type tricarboxylate transporter receptor subunit TctC
VIVPVPAGSGIDIVARVVSQQLAQQLGQPFYVENRPGAGTTIGAAAVAKAPADGYTILYHSAAFAVTPSTVANIPYDAGRDFSGVTALVNTPLVLVTPRGKYKSVRDLVHHAKAENGALNYALVGYGAAGHLVSEGFRLAAGFKAQPVPYRGTPEALTELLADRIAFYFAPLTAALPLIKEGRVDALAITSKVQASTLPNVPTMSAAGYPDSEFDFWVGMFVPSKTPREIVERLHGEARKAISMPQIKAQFAAIGGEPMPAMTPAEFDAYVGKEIARNAVTAKAAGIAPK